MPTGAGVREAPCRAFVRHLCDTRNMLKGLLFFRLCGNQQGLYDADLTRASARQKMTIKMRAGIAIEPVVRKKGT